jgi:hypothetical protein
MSQYRSLNSTRRTALHRRRAWLMQIFRHTIYVGLGGE